MAFLLSQMRNIVAITAHNKRTTQGWKWDRYEYNISTTKPDVLFDKPPTAAFVLKGVGCYFKFTLPDAFTLYSYSFAHFGAAYPVNYTFEGTNDASSSWTILDDRNGVKYKAQSTKSLIWNRFTIKNPQKFKYYRLKLKENGSSYRTNRNEFALIGFDASLTKPIKCTYKKATNINFGALSFILVNIY